MSSSDRIAIFDHAAELRDAARRLHHAAGQPGSSTGAPAVLGSLEEALQLLSAGWYELAADAGLRVVDRRRPSPAPAERQSSSGAALTLEPDLQLVAALHDLGAAFAHCARACRQARPSVRAR